MWNLKTVKQLFSLRHRSSAGRNCTLPRMVMQGLPMYLSRSGWSFPPLSLILIVNSRCNLRCKICDVGQKDKESMFYENLIGDSPEDMTLESYCSIVDQVDKNAFISITSTEPLLWKPLIPAIQWTVKSGRSMNVTTNGFLLPEFAEQLVESDLEKLTVSLDGPQQIHNKARGVENSYQNALEGIKRIAACRDKAGKRFPRILINTILSPLNQGQITEFLNHLPLDVIDQVSVELMTFCTNEVAQIHNKKFGNQYPASVTCLSGGVNPEDMDIDITLEDLKKAGSLFKERVEFRFPFNKETLSDYFFRPEKFLTKARCIYPYSSAQVNTKGDLIGLTRCYPVTFGNVIRDGFSNTWNSKKMRDFRKMIRQGERMPGCSRCEGMLYDL